jgi:hypothetical protein
MPTILLKKSDTPGSVPGTANLTNLAGGVEVAVNTADKRVYSMTSASAVIELGTNPSSLTCSDVSATVLRAGSATITNLIATSASITTLTNNPTFSGGTANGVLFLNGSKVATSGSNITFDGTDLRMPNGGSMLVGASASGGSIFLINGTAAAQRLILGTSGTDAVINATRTSGTSPNLLFQIESTEGFRLTTSTLYTASGINVGIGTSSPTQKLHVAGNILSLSAAGTDSYINVATNTVQNTYVGFNNSGSTNAAGAANNHSYFGSGNAYGIQFITNGSAAATINTSGNLGLGTSSFPSDTNFTVLGNFKSGFYRNVTSGDRGYFLNIGAKTSGGFADGGYIFGAVESGDATGYLAFGTRIGGSTTERGRFTSGGYFKASDSGTYRNAAGVYHELRNSDGSNPTVFVTNSNASTPYGIAVEFTAAAPDNNTQFFFRAEDNVAIRCYIWADGDLANHDGVYGTISDERLKQDIVDAGSQWDDLKSIRFRKYRMKTDVEANPDAPAMFGVVAQELAQVCPGLVDEHPNMKTVEVTDEEGNVTQTQEPDGTTTLTVKSSILLMKAAKALQEAMARIEQLEADMAALKASA